MVSIEDYVAASSGWGSSMLTFMQDAPSAGIDDWLLASPSACCTVVMLYLIAVMVSRGRGIVLWWSVGCVVFPQRRKSSENVWGCVCFF